jgi:hypothetical protein
LDSLRERHFGKYPSRIRTTVRRDAAILWRLWLLERRGIDAFAPGSHEDGVVGPRDTDVLSIRKTAGLHELPSVRIEPIEPVRMTRE